MDNIDLLKAKRTALKAEIDLKNIELQSLREQIGELEWIPITWEELKNLLLTEYTDSDYHNNPKVSQRNGNHYTYCFITDKGELQIGPYFYNDRFRRGEDLYIHYQREPWN